ncbi:hypothetical protein [Streptomyces griseosporeus]|uniref:hypothetical protein n=1 Tax=Streptomyces griseosporeus TaxID=1910 RepID=UPI0036FC3CA1
MSPRPLKAAVTLAATAALCLCAAPAHAAPDPDAAAWTELGKVYAATARFAYEPLAAPAGFTRSDTCVTDGQKGGMGYHYFNSANVGSLDPSKPAGLVYTTDADGSRDLAAVEWVVKDTGQAAPKLFGETFSKDVLPGHYALVAWIYEDNPSGMFAPWNTTLACPSAVTVSPDPAAPSTADTSTADTSTADTGTTGTSATDAGTANTSTADTSTADTDTAAGTSGTDSVLDLGKLDDLGAFLDLGKLDELIDLDGLTGLAGLDTLLDSLL